MATRKAKATASPATAKPRAKRRPASADFPAPSTATADIPEVVLRERVHELEVELAALREDHAALIHLRDDYLEATHNLGATTEEIRVQQEELDIATEQCQLLELKYHDLFDHSPVGYLVINQGGFIEEANLAASTMLSRPRAKLIGKPFALAFADVQRKDVREFTRRLFSAADGPQNAQNLELGGFGSEPRQTYLLRGFADTQARFPERRARISLTDITSLRRAATQSKLIDTVFSSMREALLVTDADNRILLVNRAFSEITGYTPADVIGQTPAILNSGRHARAFYKEMWDSLNRTGWWAGEIWNRRKNGEIYPEWLALSVLRNGENQLEGHVAIFSDITLRKRSENDLIRLAHFDPLTGLPNRPLLFDRLRNALSLARRHKTSAALMFIDLDRFKAVNDAYGHREGDVLLANAAQRIVSCLRESDTVARVGGDEFVAVLGFVSGELEVLEVGRKIIAALSNPFQIADNTHHIGASIGVSMFPDDGDDDETLLRHADAAMYSAKQAGRNTVRHFSRPDRERLEHEARIDQQMRSALEQNQYFLVYQPQIDAKTRRLAGFEALVRWRLADGSTVSPAEFIPVAERTGFIAQLDRRVIELGTRQIRAWLKEGIKVPPVSFNLSPQEFRREGIALEVMRQIRGQGLSPALIGLEVTESSAMADLKKTIQVLESWRKVGIKVAIDDFGTGHSSLAYLRNFPASSLKIDQCFVRAIGRSLEDAALVETMLEIARTLQLSVVAEGVETREQYHFLRDRGCDLIQGYYFSRPIEPEAAAAMIRSASPLADTALS